MKATLNWKPLEPITFPQERLLQQQLKRSGYPTLHPHLITHLAVRGFHQVKDVMAHLFPTKEQCHDPFLMKGMKETVEALEMAIISGEHITVVGDYDVDGISATAIAVQTLKKLGANVDYYIPHRKREGYGIKASVVENLKKRGTKIILTVDNGISAHEAIRLAKSYGMTVLLTDHHHPGETLPEADVVINPHQEGCPYPFKSICGGLIAFKLAQALFDYMGMSGEEDAFIEATALCTVADVMPLVDENRYFVVEGLKRMKSKPSVPIQALMKALGMDPKGLNETSIGFYMGPALNAPGRLDSAEESLKLLLSQTKLEALIFANVCGEWNKKRQVLAEAAKKEAETLLTDHPVQVLLMPSVDEGLAGILAGQLVEMTGKPAIVLTKGKTDTGKEVYKGSARTFSGFSLYDAFAAVEKKHPHVFVNWGGHAEAAGLSLDPAHFDLFHAAIQEVYEATELGVSVNEYLATIFEQDMFTLCDHMECLAPFGHGFPRPVFRVECVVGEVSIFGPKQNHLRFFSVNGSEFTLFRGADANIQVGQKLAVYVTVGKSYFAGRDKYDILVSDYEVL
ncbi:single-stranded-DNA-specific exonuclease RecJ [Cytobacillus sp. FJAT-54145]|uniref:Single-stranded-DNA-specific exonuclease RecJ n=1 Tax=Cytobacillus spartinae TaxID=3299023 RepID=A0ABW6KA13_9BACI